MKYGIFLGVIFSVFFVNNVKAEEICFENKVCYNVKIAKSVEELQKGLMWVKKIPKNEGMLFDFREFNRKDISMWMKNTFVSLDFLFIGCDGKIKDIYENAKPLSLDKISSYSDFCYVLEINANEVKNRNINVGDMMRFI